MFLKINKGSWKVTIPSRTYMCRTDTTSKEDLFYFESLHITEQVSVFHFFRVQDLIVS